MFIIECEKVWCELKYDENLTEKELLEGIESLYNFVKKNSNEVTDLFNKYSMRDDVSMTINLFNLGL